MSEYTHRSTPLRCEECPFAAWRKRKGKPEAICRGDGSHRVSAGGFASPDWCPLRKGPVIVRAYP